MSVPDVSGAAIANLEVESLIHRAPTFHGDTIYAETKVIDKVESKSRDDRGVVTVETKGVQPARRGGVLLPPQGHGVEARRSPRRVGVPTGTTSGIDRRCADGRAGRRASVAPTGRRPSAASPRSGPWARPSRSGGPAGGRLRRPELPWRSTRDPWAVLVSEVMAQQTQVARVVPAYRRFLAAFPHSGGLCGGAAGRRAPGLGGPGLQPAGPQPAPGGRGHGRPSTAGGCPTTSTPCWRCPASGPTRPGPCWPSPSSADVGVVDTNAGRVLARAVAGRSAAAGARPSDWSTPWCPAGRGWSFGQALLDLGATGLRGRRPRLRAARSAAGAGGRPPGGPTRPGPRLGRGVDGPEPLRRIRPPGSRSAGRRPCGMGPVPPARSRRPWDGPMTRPGRPGSSTGC